jgi:hypothetical protein
MNFLAWLEQTEFSVWLRESDWGHPIVLCFHAVGMGMVVGICVMFSARVLGYSKNVPLNAFDRLFGLAWIGFWMNAVSGVVLFSGSPRRLLETPAFLIKMVLIAAAGFSLWVLTRMLQGVMEQPQGAYAGAGQGMGENGDLPVSAKVAAVFPVLFWIGAIVSGRLIAYTIGPPPL